MMNTGKNLIEQGGVGQKDTTNERLENEKKAREFLKRILPEGEYTVSKQTKRDKRGNKTSVKGRDFLVNDLLKNHESSDFVRLIDSRNFDAVADILVQYLEKTLHRDVIDGVVEQVRTNLIKVKLRDTLEAEVGRKLDMESNALGGNLNKGLVDADLESRSKTPDADDVIEVVESKKTFEKSSAMKPGGVSNKRIADKIENTGYVIGAKPGTPDHDFELKSKVLSSMKTRPADDTVQERRQEIEKFEQMRNVKSFEELLILLGDQDFPGIQGSKQFYSGDDLRRIVAGAREMGVTNFVTSSQGLRDTVERLLHQEKEGKIGSMKEDGIVEGFGVAGGVVPEIISEENVKDSSETEGENVLEGEYSPQGEMSTRELHSRARELKIDADVARNDYLKLKHRNESKWLAVKRALFASRPKELPENLVDELSVLRINWNHKLTLYKNAVVELVKREAEDRKLDGRGKGLLMAEAIRGLDFQGSIENYNAWKDAAWGNREDSRFLRGLGRAKNWAEQYRTLDWKKRMAISALALGTGVAGVATGSAGLVGLGVAGSTLIRLLGSYGVGRVSYEYLEGRANRKTVQYHEAALSNVERIDDIRFLEQRMRSYADRTQENLNRAIAGNRKRVVASVALGTLLFAGGSALAHHGAIREVSGKVSSGFSKLLEQMKIITGIEDFHDAPISSNISSSDINITNVPPPQLDVPEITDLGIINHERAAEVVEKIGKSIAETGTVPKGGSFEGVLIEKLTESGGFQGDAGKLAHRAMLDFAERSGKSFEIFNYAQPGDGISYEVAPNGSIHVIDVTRKMSGEVIKQAVGSISAENTPFVPDVDPPPIEEVTELTPLHPLNLPEIHSVVETTPVVPIDTTLSEVVPTSSVEPSLATNMAIGVGAGGLAVAGAALLGREIRARRRAQQQVEEKKNVEEVQEKARGVFLRVAGLTQIPEDRRRALWMLSGEYGAYEKRRPSDEVFEETRKKIATIVFGSENIPEDVLDNMFLSVAQRGMGDPGNKNLEEMRTGIKNGYSVFQALFGRTGERLPAGRVVGLSVRDVLRLFTERFLTGKIPEELRNSGT